MDPEEEKHNQSVDLFVPRGSPFRPGCPIPSRACSSAAVEGPGKVSSVVERVQSRQT